MFWGGGSRVGGGSGWEEEEGEIGSGVKGELGGGGGGTDGEGLMTDPARPRCRRPLDRVGGMDGGGGGGGGVSADIFRQLLLRSKCM